MKLTHDFELDGKQVTGRCTFRAINAFEESSGLSIAEAWTKLSENKLGFSGVARAVWAFINGEKIHNGQRPMAYEVVGEKMHQEGFIKFIAVAGQFFLMTLPESENGSDQEVSSEKKS